MQGRRDGTASNTRKGRLRGNKTHRGGAEINEGKGPGLEKEHVSIRSGGKVGYILKKIRSSGTVDPAHEKTAEANPKDRLFSGRHKTKA